jgi:hypothetical protein
MNFDKAVNEYIELSTMPGLGRMLPIDNHTISARPEDSYPNAEYRVDVELPEIEHNIIRKYLKYIIKQLQKAR